MFRRRRNRRIFARSSRRYAPQLFLQAGSASILAGSSKNGLDRLKQGLSLLAGRGQLDELTPECAYCGSPVREEN